jgi:hypothetical protein
MIAATGDPSPSSISLPVMPDSSSTAWDAPEAQRA